MPWTAQQQHNPSVHPKYSDFIGTTGKPQPSLTCYEQCLAVASQGVLQQACQLAVAVGDVLAGRPLSQRIDHIAQLQ